MMVINDDDYDDEDDDDDDDDDDDHIDHIDHRALIEPHTYNLAARFPVWVHFFNTFVSFL
jgi:hypothetical protein